MSLIYGSLPYLKNGYVIIKSAIDLANNIELLN